MSYILYVSNNCPACDRAQEFLEKRGLLFELINVTDPGKNPVKGVFIYPALFSDKKLVAYGDDIISWLDRVA